ncbi:MAG TPA: hypothetical protein VG028_00855 [Terriglobia bacterium]|nr:hypothetical protein [Terriglobia bacterium]
MENQIILSQMSAPAKEAQLALVTHFDVAPPFRAANAGLKPGSTKSKWVTTQLALVTPLVAAALYECRNC